jgi:hypothetical protein
MHITFLCFQHTAINHSRSTSRSAITIKFSTSAYLKLQDHERNNQAYLRQKRLSIHLIEMCFRHVDSLKCSCISLTKTFRRSRDWNLFQVYAHARCSGIPHYFKQLCTHTALCTGSDTRNSIPDVPTHHYCFVCSVT